MISKRMLLLLTVCLSVFLSSAHAQDGGGEVQGPGPGEAPGATLEFGGLTFVWCPPGSFSAGSPIDAAAIAAKFGGLPEWYADEYPARNVDISAGYWISRTEITRAQWVALLNTRPWGETPAPSDDVPAAQISWEEANAFTLEFSKQHRCVARLPQEAEWEYACRAGSQENFHFGAEPDGLPLHAQYRLNAERGMPRPVGERGANAWGLTDILGNVWEWCQDKYSLPDSPRPSPAGSVFRIIRGGAANSTAAHLRCSYRTSLPMDARSPHIGMRLVVEP